MTFAKAQLANGDVFVNHSGVIAFLDEGTTDHHYEVQVVGLSTFYY